MIGYKIMKTFSAKSHEVQRDWLLVDATDATLGRLASAIAHRLRGKHKESNVIIRQKSLKILIRIHTNASDRTS